MSRVAEVLLKQDAMTLIGNGACRRGENACVGRADGRGREGTVERGRGDQEAWNGGVVSWASATGLSSQLSGCASSRPRRAQGPPETGRVGWDLQFPCS